MMITDLECVELLDHLTMISNHATACDMHMALC